MFVESANRLNVQVSILDAENSPAKQISAHSKHLVGSFKDPDSIRKLAKDCDVLTVEIEHVDVDVLEEVSKTVRVEPHPSTLRIIKDKYLQKQHLKKHSVATADCLEVPHLDSESDLERVASQWGYPSMLKSKTEAYDGRGNYPLRSEKDIPEAFKALGGRPLYLEKWADFSAELAVMVVNSKDETLTFPTVETVHEDSICKLVYAPARDVPRKALDGAQELARRAIATFRGKGVFGVELFLLKDGKLLVNEIAPRPHNSGHYTIEACPISQYDAHLRAILDIPIKAKSLRLREPAIMLNILGGSQTNSHVQIASIAAQTDSDVSIHLYGKGEARPGRKMGHMTVTAPTMHEAEDIMNPLIDATERQKGKKPTQNSRTPKQTPLVAVVMGSDSDLPKLKDGLSILEKFNIPYQARITSAHRTPSWMAQFATDAESAGFKVIIAAAGGAAHLPGMAAAHTPLPVIGVPIGARHLDGVDSLYSIVQMPRGVPVATVAIDNSTNAALLAIRILATQDARIMRDVKAYMEDMEKGVLKKDAKLAAEGATKYLAEM